MKEAGICYSRGSTPRIQEAVVTSARSSGFVHADVLPQSADYEAGSPMLYISIGTSYNTYLVHRLVMRLVMVRVV